MNEWQSSGWGIGAQDKRGDAVSMLGDDLRATMAPQPCPMRMT